MAELRERDASKEARVTKLEKFRAWHPSPKLHLPIVLNGCKFLPNDCVCICVSVCVYVPQYIF